MKSLATLALLLFAGPIFAADLTETVDRTIDVKPGARVVLSNTNGRVNVVTWDQPRVRVVARKEVSASREQLKSVMSELRVDIQSRDGGVIVQTHYPKRNEGVNSIFDWMLGNDVQAEVAYDVTVPVNMSLDVETVNGSIRMSGVNGKHELETTNGKIELTRCAGSVEASTTNGSISADLLQVSKGEPLDFETTNGRITVTLPSNLAVNVDASTTNGSIESDLVVATTRITKNSLRGAINGGGTALRLRTTNGGIEIRSAAGRNQVSSR
jgi:hypothetical protein